MRCSLVIPLNNFPSTIRQRLNSCKKTLRILLILQNSSFIFPYLILYEPADQISCSCQTNHVLLCNIIHLFIVSENTNEVPIQSFTGPLLSLPLFPRRCCPPFQLANKDHYLLLISVVMVHFICQLECFKGFPG